MPKLEVVAASVLRFSIEHIFLPPGDFLRNSTRISIFVYRVAPMALSFSVGDFFAVGQFAWSVVFKACKCNQEFRLPNCRKQELIRMNWQAKASVVNLKRSRTKVRVWR
jgi:hypothetical protein